MLRCASASRFGSAFFRVPRRGLLSMIGTCPSAGCGPGSPPHRRHPPSGHTGSGPLPASSSPGESPPDCRAWTPKSTNNSPGSLRRLHRCAVCTGPTAPGSPSRCACPPFRSPSAILSALFSMTWTPAGRSVSSTSPHAAPPGTAVFSRRPATAEPVAVQTLDQARVVDKPNTALARNARASVARLCGGRPLSAAPQGRQQRFDADKFQNLYEALVALAEGAEFLLQMREQRFPEGEPVLGYGPSNGQIRSPIPRCPRFNCLRERDLVSVFD